MRSPSHVFLIALGVASGCLAFGSRAEAQNKTWTGTANGTWSTGTNWSPTGAPGTGNATVFDGTGANLTTTTSAPFTGQSLTFTAGQTSPVTINTTTTNFLRLSSTSPIVVNAGNHLILGNGTAASGAAWDFSFDGADSTARTISIAGNASLEIQARVSNTNGSGTNFNRSLTKTGNGTLNLSGINNGTGAWQFFGGNTFSINQGVVRLSSAGSYGNGQNAYVVASDAALELAGGVSQNLIFGGTSNGSISLNGTGIGSAGALRSLSGSNTLTGNSSLGIVLAANSSIGVDAGHLFLNIPITMNGTGSWALTKVGAGKLTLNGTSSYNGTTTISAGTLQLARTVALYNNTPSNWTASNVRVNAGTLALNVGGTGEFSTGNVTTLLTNLGGSNGTSTEGFAAGSTIGFDTTNASGGNFTVSDVIADSTGSGGGAIGLAKLGVNRLILTGNNSYTGPTTVEAGTLAINGALGATSVTVSSGARLQGSGSIAGPVTVLGGGTLATGNSIESLATGALGPFRQLDIRLRGRQ